MSDVTPADLRAGPFRVAVTGDGERVRYHEEMGHQYPDCDCEYWESDAEHERERPPVPHNECWLEPWMDDCAVLCGPDGEPVQSGPIIADFNGDCVEWEYADKEES